MTRDEVMAMTDEELRVKAAVLSGWIQIKNIWHHPDQDDSDDRGCMLPDYTNDIADAWGLVDRLRDECYLSMRFEYGQDIMLVSFSDDFISNTVRGEPPRAITCAFILAMGSKESDEKEPMIQPD